MHRRSGRPHRPREFRITPDDRIDSLGGDGSVHGTEGLGWCGVSDPRWRRGRESSHPMSSAQQFPLQGPRVQALEQAELEGVVDVEEAADHRPGQCFLHQCSPIHAPSWRRALSPTSSTHLAPVHGTVASPGVNPVIRGDPKLPWSVGPARAAVQGPQEDLVAVDTPASPGNAASCAVTSMGKVN
jgi:hypothetical protein